MRYFLFCLLSTISLNACALCALYSPTAHVKTDLVVKDGYIKKVRLTWTFSENFSNLMLKTYDQNSDKKLEKKEIHQILRGLMDYLAPNEFLTSINYYKEGEDEKSLLLKIVDYDIYFKDSRLWFMNEFQANIKVEESLVVSVKIFDEKEYFHFNFLDGRSTNINNSLSFIQNTNSNVVFFKVVKNDEALIDDNKIRLSEVINLENQYAKIDAIDEAKFDSLSKVSLGFLDRLKDIIRQNQHSPSLVSISLMMFFSFVYGFLHAAGPGHAKLLTSAYFAANGGSYLHAFVFSLKVGFLHVAGALILVCATFFTVREVSAVYDKDLIQITTIICAIMIMIISFYMFYVKLKIMIKPKVYLWNAHKIDCDCSACKALETKNFNSSKEWLIAGCSALVPCPGIVLVFILAFGLGSYMIGLLSGLFMGLGMSLLIFIAGIFGQSIHKNAFSKFEKLKKYGEFIALIVMFGLGVFMLIISFNTGVF